MAKPRHLIPVSRHASLCLSFYIKTLVLVALGLSSAPAAMAQAPETTAESAFAEVPFDQWVAEGPRQQVPWEVHASAHLLSIHQRLIASIEVVVPGTELVKRHADGRITLLVKVTDKAGASYRNFCVLELNDMKTDMRKTDMSFSWDAFALPGEYNVDVALYDKAAGEHNLYRGKLHVNPLKNDPLRDAWDGLPNFAFWSTKRDGPDYLFHSDIDGRLHLPLKTKRPVRLELLADLSSSDTFKGSTAAYEQYLAVALPTFKAFSHINVSNGSLHLATLDLPQRRVSFTQDDGKDLDWPRLKAMLVPTNGPGVVSVGNLRERRRQSPVFLREELMRRIDAAPDPGDAQAEKGSQGKEGSHKQEGSHKEDPLRVFVLIGSPMDLYAFPDLPPINLRKEDNCVLYYLQYEFPNQRAISPAEFRIQNGLPGSDSLIGRRPAREDVVGRGLDGAIGNVERMLRPLKIHVLKVSSAADVRRALARVLADVSEM